MQAVLAAVSTGSEEALDDAIANLSDDEKGDVAQELLHLPSAPAVALQWAMRLFDQTFHDAIAGLLRANPLDKMEDDEDGGQRPFWGGARRVPVPASFDISVAEHRSFVTFAAMLWGRSRGQEGGQWTQEALDNLLLARPGDNNSSASSIAGDVDVCDAVRAVKVGDRESLLSSLQVQEFEKVLISMAITPHQ